MRKRPKEGHVSVKTIPTLTTDATKSGETLWAALSAADQRGPGLLLSGVMRWAADFHPYTIQSRRPDALRAEALPRCDQR